MNFSTISSETARAVTDDVCSKVMNITNSFGNLLNNFVTTRVNTTYNIAIKLGNVSKEGVTSLIKATDDVGICGIISSNVTSGNVTTTVSSYDPAACGVYGSFPAIKPLLIFILVCFTIWTIFGNCCLVGVIATDKNMQEPGNIFLCALAFTDIALSFTYTPASIYGLIHGKSPGGHWCRAQAFVIPFLGTLSIYLLTCLWICRYVHIAYPYKYQKLLARGRLILAMALCFLVALTPPVVGLARVGKVSTWALEVFAVDIAEPGSIMMPCAPGGPERTVTVSLCLLGVIISCCFAGLIYREARKSQKKHDQKRAWRAQADKLDKKLKAAKTLGIVVGVQWITYLPAITFAFLSQFGVYTIATRAILGDIVYVIGQTSTFSDSIVYAFRNKIYRRALAKMYRKMRNAIISEL